ncbi:MAG: hypothetical protein FWH27_04270 [Planctomycetaceae bacterium]|nr:hypothetical protein [Planctomycetaceae bacterium]
MESNAIMPEIPEKLKWYQPQNRWCRISNGPLPWRIVVDETAGTIEIKRTPLFRVYWLITETAVGTTKDHWVNAINRIEL